MAGLIPQNFIDDLLSRADILDVVDSRVKLRKTGKNYSGLCPFHQEKTPSFTVQPDKQFYYCFGCGAGGNALGFIMNYDNLEFVDAVELLAKDMGVEVPREESSRRSKASASRYEALLRLLSDISKWYQSQLRQHDQKTKAVDYLKSRGLSGEVARDYGLGYAPPGWSNLLQHFGTDENRQKQLLDTGMLIENPDNKKNPRYDRFRDRIMYPIRDARGRVLGFGGRVLGNDKPKYLNSPETVVFRKGEELYGLYEAKRKLRNPERYLIVEGYMDVIALAQYGIHNCVATLGTATSEAHLRTLFKQASEVVFCFDGDNAGRDAAWRALQVILPLMEDGRSGRFLFLPEGQDPDSQVRSIGPDAFNASVASATSLADFFFDTLCARLDANTLEGKAKLGKQAIPLLEKLPSGIFKQLMLDQLSERTGVAVADLPRQKTSETPASAPSPNEPPPFDQQPYYEHDLSPMPPPMAPDFRSPRKQERMRVELSPCMRAVNLLVRKPDIIASTEGIDELNDINAQDLELLLKVINIAKAAPDSSTPELMSRIYATDFGSHLTQLLGRELITPEAGIENEFRDIVKRLLSSHKNSSEKQKTVETLRQKHASRQNRTDPSQPIDS